MKHKIVFIDMDGTLYQTENDVIQESSIAAIQSLKNAGYIVAAATGRPLNQMKLILERVKFDYYVLINGGYVLDADFNEIGSDPIQKETVEELVELARANEYGLMFHFGMRRTSTTTFIRCTISANTATSSTLCSTIRTRPIINVTGRSTPSCSRKTPPSCKASWTSTPIFAPI